MGQQDIIGNTQTAVDVLNISQLWCNFFSIFLGEMFIEAKITFAMISCSLIGSGYTRELTGNQFQANAKKIIRSLLNVLHIILGDRKTLFEKLKTKVVM